jgi:hypothetical protein
MERYEQPNHGALIAPLYDDLSGETKIVSVDGLPLG